MIQLYIFCICVRKLSCPPFWFMLSPTMIYNLRKLCFLEQLFEMFKCIVELQSGDSTPAPTWAGSEQVCNGLKIVICCSQGCSRGYTLLYAIYQVRNVVIYMYLDPHGHVFTFEAKTCQILIHVHHILSSLFTTTPLAVQTKWR